MSQVPGSNSAWDMYLYGTVMDSLYDGEKIPTRTEAPKKLI